jgi:5-methyltetrahydropteroyltriglutamate--homocysteine methyltransferase
MIRNGAEKLLPTAVVGSYPQPDWLIDRRALGAGVPRLRRPELWRVDAAWLEQAQDDATELALRAMERAGIDVVTDGEIRRESYSNRFATALDGLDLEHPGETIGRGGVRIPVPRVVGPISRPGPIGVEDVVLLRRSTDKTIKATIPGPFTLSQQVEDDYYGDGSSLALGFADAVNQELHDLVDAGADVVQLDEPWLQSRPERAAAFAVDAIDRALAGIDVATALHLCCGYAAVVEEKPRTYPFLVELDACSVGEISIEAAQPKVDLSVLRGLQSKRIAVGVLDLGDPEIETVDVVARRIRAALVHVPPERLVVSPDCGMKYLPRDVAYGKLCAMVAGAALVRAELTS